MYLKDFIPNTKKEYKDVFFSGVSFNSTEVKKNDIFFAIKGNNCDGNDFIDIAIKKGAKVVISQKRFKKKREKQFLYPQQM